MVLSKKDRRKLNKSTKTTRRSPAKSTPNAKAHAIEATQPPPVTLDNPFRALFTPQSLTERQQNGDTVIDLLMSARSTRTNSDATTVAAPLLKTTRKDSVLDDDIGTYQNFRPSPRGVVHGTIQGIDKDYASVSNLDGTESDRSEDFTTGRSFLPEGGMVYHDDIHISPSQPIDIPQRTSSSFNTVSTVPTARPSPSFGFALFRPTRECEEARELPQPLHAQSSISPNDIFITSSSATLSDPVPRPGVRLRTESTASLIFQLDLQNEDEDDIEYQGTVRHNPLPSQKNPYHSSAVSSGMLQIVTKLPSGDVEVEECTSTSSISSVSSTESGFLVPSPAAIASVSDIPIDRLRISVIEGIDPTQENQLAENFAGSSTTTDPELHTVRGLHVHQEGSGHHIAPGNTRQHYAVESLTGPSITTDPELHVLEEFRFDQGESTHQITPPSSPGFQLNVRLRSIDINSVVAGENAGTAELFRKMRHVDSGCVENVNIANEPARRFPQLRAEEISRTLEQSRAIREGKKPASSSSTAPRYYDNVSFLDVAGVVERAWVAKYGPSPDFYSGVPSHELRQMIPSLRGRNSYTPSYATHKARSSTSVDAGMESLTRMLLSRPLDSIPKKVPFGETPSGSEFDSEEGTDSDNSSSSFSSLDIGRPVIALDVEAHQREQKEKAAARKVTWKAARRQNRRHCHELRRQLEREFTRNVEGVEMFWANRPRGVKLRPQDRTIPALTKIETPPRQSASFSGSPKTPAELTRDGDPSTHEQPTSAPSHSWSPVVQAIQSPSSQSADAKEDSNTEFQETMQSLSVALAGMTTKVRQIQSRLRNISAASSLARGSVFASIGAEAAELWATAASISPIAGPSTKSAAGATKYEDVDFASLSSVAGPSMRSAPITVPMNAGQYNQATRLARFGEPRPGASSTHQDIHHAERASGYNATSWKLLIKDVLGKELDDPITDVDKKILWYLIKEGHIVPPVLTIRPDVWTDNGIEENGSSSRGTYTPGVFIRTTEEWRIFVAIAEALEGKEGANGLPIDLVKMLRKRGEGDDK